MPNDPKWLTRRRKTKEEKPPMFSGEYMHVRNMDKRSPSRFRGEKSKNVKNGQETIHKQVERHQIASKPIPRISTSRSSGQVLPAGTGVYAWQSMESQ
jgi:hypothetical protein